MRPIAFSLGLLLGVLAAAAPAAAVPLERADLETWLDSYMGYAMAKADIAGAEVVVVKDGQVLFAKGYGYSDVARRAPVDPKTTLFRPGSVSKTFTWTALMQLVEQGRVDLDADVNRYLDFKVPPLRGRPVTVRNLVTHTPGFEEDLGDLFSTRRDRLEPELRQYLVETMPRRVFEPGKVTAYSNYGATLAGYIVQRVSGEPFEDYVARHIFAPLGMAHASFAQPLPPALRPLMSKGYATASEGPQPFEMITAAPAGGLTASGDDIARFMIAHLAEGRGILRPETARMMHETPWTLLPAGSRNLLGFYETGRNGHRVIAHGGDTTLFHSEMHLLLDDRVGIYAVMNSNGQGGDTLLSSLIQRFDDRYFPGPSRDGAVDAATARAHAAMMAGTYESSLRYAGFFSVLKFLGQPRVTANADGTITVPGFNGLDGQPKRWREIAPFVWRETRGQDLLGARVENGRVVMFSAGEQAQSTMLTPVPWTRDSAWLLPALQAALAVMALTVLAWPVMAFARRPWRRPSPLAVADVRAWRGARIGALAALMVLGLFAWRITAMTSDFSLLSHRSDLTVWLLHALALAGFPAALALALWNGWRTWRRPADWLGKLWASLLVAATSVLLWVALAFHLIGFSGRY